MKYIAILDSDDKLSEKAIDDIKHTVFCGDEQVPYCFDIDSVEEVTDQTRKKGKWIDTKEISTNRKGQIVHEVICSECNGISYFRGMDDKYIGANLCPNCGAEMESEE